MGNHTSRPGSPSNRIQVISAGFGGTGSSTLALALERVLKGPAAHGGSQITHFGDVHAKSYDKLLMPSPRNLVMRRLRDMTRGYVAVTGGPAVCFIPELLELYPNAKVVLVEQDPAAWQKSTSRVLGVLSPWYMYWLLLPCPGYRWLPSIARKCVLKAAEHCPSFSNGSDALSPSVLEEHNAWVRSVVPERQILQMRLEDGWEPLCRFLDKPIPDEPFPTIEDSEDIEDMSRMMWHDTICKWRSLAALAFEVAVLVASFTLATRLRCLTIPSIMIFFGKNQSQKLN